MKVKDLIIELSLCDPDYDVWVTHESDETGEVGEPQLVYQDNEYEDVIISFAGMGCTRSRRDDMFSVWPLYGE